MPSKSNSAVKSNESAPVLDRQHLARYTLGDAGLERELLQLFIDQMHLSLGKLKSAVTTKEWRLACHTLKGSAAAVGAAEINRLAVALEARCFTGTPAAGDAGIAALELAGRRFQEATGRIIG